MSVFGHDYEGPEIKGALGPGLTNGVEKPAGQMFAGKEWLSVNTGEREEMSIAGKVPTFTQLMFLFSAIGFHRR